MSEILDRSGLDRQLGFVLRLADAAVWNDLRLTLAPHKLKPQGYAVLLIVAGSPGCKQQDVADALGIQRPNLVGLIDTLVTGGFIDRQVNVEDRRSNTLVLTAAGDRLLGAAQTAHAGHERRLAGLLADIDGESLLAGLARLMQL